MTISALSVERYVSICHPIWFTKHKLSSKPRAVKIIIIIWLVGFIFALLEWYILGISSYKSKYGKTICIFTSSPWQDLIKVTLIFFFILTVLIISFMYLLIWIKLRKSAKAIQNTRKQRVPKIICKSHIFDSRTNINLKGSYYFIHRS